MPENNFRPEAWKRTFGLNDDQVFFFRYHLKADEDHAGQEVWEPILRHVKSEADREEIFSGLVSTLIGEKLFYQGICEAGDGWDRQQKRGGAHVEPVAHRDCGRHVSRSRGKRNHQRNDLVDASVGRVKCPVETIAPHVVCADGSGERLVQFPRIDGRWPGRVDHGQVRYTHL